MRVGNDNDVSTLAAVTPVRAALGDVFFASKADDAVPAIASFHLNFRFVNKHLYLFGQR
jgi:hypothetical protein